MADTHRSRLLLTHQELTFNQSSRRKMLASHADQDLQTANTMIGMGSRKGAEKTRTHSVASLETIQNNAQLSCVSRQQTGHECVRYTHREREKQSNISKNLLSLTSESGRTYRNVLTVLLNISHLTVTRKRSVRTNPLKVALTNHNHRKHCRP